MTTSKKPINFNLIREGDASAFRTLFEIYYPRAKSVACRFVEEYIAEDITQDIFTKVWHQRETICPDNIGSYIYKSIQNQCLNYLKHISITTAHNARLQLAQQRVAYIQTSFDNDDTNEVWSYVQNRNIHELIEKAMMQLPPKCAEAFRLTYIENMSNQEAATIMGVSVRTVETHIYKALNLLRRHLKGLLVLLLIMLTTHRQ